MFAIIGEIYDLLRREIYCAELKIRNGRIVSIKKIPWRLGLPKIVPVFVDAHVHVESSMVHPARFARMAVVKGTGATVNDPHEIGNVCGVEGVYWMLRSAELVDFNFCFGAPSCVPALGLPFENAGAIIDSNAVDSLLAHPKIGYLAEVMNHYGVVNGDAELLAKIASSKRHNKPIDGHAPLARGEHARRYAAAGPSTDHECTTLEEALEKIEYGMKILIREGSAARDFAALHPLLGIHPDRVMFCSDDLHPDLFEIRHIDGLVRRAIQLGYPIFDVLCAASKNPIEHYGLPVGLLQEGDSADFLVLNGEFDTFTVEQTWLKGKLVAEKGVCLLPQPEPIEPINHFKVQPFTAEQFAVPATANRLRAIEVTDGKIVTGSVVVEAVVRDGNAVACPSSGLLKLIVINRYTENPTPAIGFATGFSLLRGALACSVAHDCHNIVVIAADDQSAALAVNEVIRLKGGLVATDGVDVRSLALPVAGLMSLEPGEIVAAKYRELNAFARELGCTMEAGFMSLSFLALPVIPALKLSDTGLVDASSIQRVSLFC